MNEREREIRTVAPDGRPDSEQPAWRQDFPIDAAQDHYVARRDFTKFMGLASLGFVFGQLWIALKSKLAGTPAPAPPKIVARLDDIPIGSALTFSFPDEHDSCLLLRPDADTLVAYSQRCTHLSCAVTPGECSEELRCPCHHGTFDALTGRPLAGPPRRPLTRIRLEVIDNVIHAVDQEHRTI